MIHQTVLEPNWKSVLGWILDGQFHESAWLGYIPVIQANTNPGVGQEDIL